MTLLNAMGSALSGLSAQQVRLDVVGDNLANASTTGFKASRVDFEAALAETLRIGSRPEGSQLGGVNPLQTGSGVAVAGVTRDVGLGGALVPTGIAGDLAVDGSGFFLLADGEGGLVYTRDGAFSVDAAGVLRATASGFAVQGLNADLSTFTVPPGGPAEDVEIPLGVLTVPGGVLTDFHVDADGTVQGEFSNGDTHPLGRILLARFANPGGLESAGQNLFRAGAASGAALTGTPGQDGLGEIRGGTLEASNVDFARELGELISAQRAFQANARVLSRADRLLEDLVNIV